MFFSKSVLATAAFAALALAESLPAKTLSQLSLGTFLENIAVRPNGDLLVTQLFPSASIYTIKSPSGSKAHVLEELVSIPAIQNIFGIAQVPRGGHDTETYVVVGSNSTQGNPIPGTFSAWTVDFLRDARCGKVKVSKVSGMSKDSAFLNGVAAIPGVSNAVLIADSASGLVGRLDLKTGKFDTLAFVFPEMAPTKGAPLPVGVNGIHIRNGFLYFTNSGTVSIYRIAVTPRGLPAKGAKPELLVDLSDKTAFLDDFTFDADGNIYVATNWDNSVMFVDLESGKAETVVGGRDEMTVTGSTAVAFGRGKRDKDTLYVVTSGGLGNPVRGTKTEGSKVVAVDTSA